MTRTVLLTGASGKIGHHAAKAFSDAGWQIRRFQRGTDMTQAAQGCDVIVNGMNPPKYHNWAEIIPEITRQHIAAARASGATVIIPGNVYTFGDRCDGAWDETTPHRPCSRKGQIRVEMEQAYRDAGIQTIVLRAGNFIDPDSADDLFSMIILGKLGKNRFVHAADPAVRQEWCILPDWARAAVALADKRHDLAAFEDVPCGNHAVTGSELKARFEALTGRSLRDASFAWWQLRLAAPVLELARELLEMRYLYDLDHALSDAKLRRLLPDWAPTPLDQALAAKLAMTTGTTAKAA
ncbi:sugar nucleotide-binding protein [Mesobacterium pallidum]|uniref:sugar nucleotide-binding protein n=1 Tax=Mesobacterium pallidum TaxID=2872037 RepID=UPI001EE24C7F|nr:sugar nucleotide-binding protein [Mesobacterium pallidum]